MPEAVEVLKSNHAAWPVPLTEGVKGIKVGLGPYPGLGEAGLGEAGSYRADAD
jgi:hypothetical protein